jgi:cyclase
MASARGRGPILDLISRVAEQVFIPFCVGGGIGSIEDIRSTILAGAEKISLNSQAVKNPDLIREGARIFGNQCIVLGMDAAKDSEMPSGYRVYINGGRVKTDLDALEWAKKAVSLGAGEIVLNSIDADGVRQGYELNVTRMIAENVSVPVIASGGGGTPQHLADVLTEGKADAALIASMVHSMGYTVDGIKQDLTNLGVPVRLGRG